MASTPASDTPPLSATDTVPPRVGLSEGDGSDDAGNMAPQRTLILHYHLFKNAGTSIDVMLKHNFGSKWISHEFHGSGNFSNSHEVASFLRQQGEICALSSHTALLPVPRLEGVHIVPVIFLRHPIDRLKSAYLFERSQDSAEWSAQVAKRNDLAGYIRELLDHKRHRSARNFQTLRLSLNEEPSAGSERERAMRTLRALPFVGLVEAFPRSVNRLCKILAPYFPQFLKIIVHENTSRPTETTLDDRLVEIEDELGPDLFERLRLANEDDLLMFDTVRRLYSDETNL
ncbi:MAG: hypothetical protein ACM3JG_09740 [Thiohalocapsa sp.]